MGRTSREGFVSYRSARDVVFLECRDTVFCAECELISYNNSPRCLACGSIAVLSLARVLGGSLLTDDTAKAVPSERVELDGDASTAVEHTAWEWQVAIPVMAAMRNRQRPVETAQFLN